MKSSIEFNKHFNLKGSCGLTLIEVLIVVALIAMLAVTAAPLTGSWIAESQITDAESTLTEAVGRAKSAAMRNKPAVEGAGAVAIVCISSNKVEVKERKPGVGALACVANDSDSVELWSSSMPSQITLSYNPEGTLAVACMCFDRRGLPTTSNCSGCSVGSHIYFSRGTLARHDSYVQ